MITAKTNVISSGGAGTDDKVAIDALATAGYLGIASTDGVLRSLSPITYTDGGNFITIGISQSGVATDGYLSLTDWGTFNNKESVLTFSTGLTRVVNTITTNDSQINHNNLSNTHNLTTNIDHNSITNTHQGVDTGNTPSFIGLTSTGTVNIDDGVGDSPLLYLIDVDNKFLSLQKMDAGEANIINNEGQINIKPSGDVDDYLVISTATNVVQIGVDDDLDLLQLVNGIVSINGSISLKNFGEIRFYDDGANYVGFEAPALIANQIWVLPNIDGNIRQVLSTDGAGNLSWDNTADFPDLFMCMGT